ncbi:antibiotic biosynthesis monooxygenase [Sorangium sp. So ce302]|uniref:hypothetical protein n=1 Tax=Sorangium sp. So ce302 TaxID=3133297 RepID=UPI003F5FE5E5
MVMVIDLLETRNRPVAADAWRAVCSFLSEQPGFEGGQLLEIFQTLRPRTGWEMVSVCRWSSAEDWERARAAVRQNAELVSVLGAAGTKFTGFKMDLVDGSEYRFRPPSGNMVLVDLMFLPEERMAAYAAMWAEAAQTMSQLAGYVNSSLYRTRNLADEVKFINVAEWDSAERFFAGVHGDRFVSIVEPFKSDFALHLSRRVALYTAPR